MLILLNLGNNELERRLFLGRQVFVSIQEVGAFQNPKFNRSSNQDLVPKSQNKMEEPNGGKIKACAAPRINSANSAATAASLLCRSGCSSLFPAAPVSVGGKCGRRPYFVPTGPATNDDGIETGSGGSNSGFELNNLTLTSSRQFIVLLQLFA